MEETKKKSLSRTKIAGLNSELERLLEELQGHIENIPKELPTEESWKKKEVVAARRRELLLEIDVFRKFSEKSEKFKKVTTVLRERWKRLLESLASPLRVRIFQFNIYAIEERFDKILFDG